jgi:hypothetical protein
MCTTVVIEIKAGYVCSVYSNNANLRVLIADHDDFAAGNQLFVEEEVWELGYMSHELKEQAEYQCIVF